MQFLKGTQETEVVARAASARANLNKKCNPDSPTVKEEAILLQAAVRAEVVSSSFTFYVKCKPLSCSVKWIQRGRFSSFAMLQKANTPRFLMHWKSRWPPTEGHYIRPCRELTPIQIVRPISPRSLWYSARSHFLRYFTSPTVSARGDHYKLIY